MAEYIWLPNVVLLLYSLLVEYKIYAQYAEYTHTQTHTDMRKKIKQINRNFAVALRRISGESNRNTNGSVSASLKEVVLSGLWMVSESNKSNAHISKAQNDAKKGKHLYLRNFANIFSKFTEKKKKTDKKRKFEIMVMFKFNIFAKWVLISRAFFYDYYTPAPPSESKSVYSVKDSECR